MKEKIKTIPKKDLRPGMFVRSYGKGTFRDPFVDVDRFIESFEDIAKYLPDETAQVEVLSDAFLPEVSSKETKQRSASEAARELAESLPHARQIHEEALHYARKFMDNVRNGEAIKMKEAEPMIDKVIDSISSNQPAALTLAFLKKFDEYTYTHCINVNLYSLLLGQALGLGRKELEKLGIAAIFHDVGKGRIPTEVLNKPGKLSKKEFEVMKEHSMLGRNVLKEVRGLDLSILRGVVEHHERYDGNGYPRKLRGEQIHSFARIIAIADVYDALTSVRVYKKAMSPARTLSRMHKWSGTDFDQGYLTTFIRIMGVYPPGTIVQLNDERFALVLETNESSPLHPKVKIMFNRKMQPIQPEYVDLQCEESLKVIDQPAPEELGINMKQLARFLI